MKVHYLQHVSFEGLGYIESWLTKNNHTLSSTGFYEPGYRLPEAGNIDALIVMGGPMGVYDEDRFPWLKEEKAFIKHCIQSGKKVLGICLGAQLIADCLGAKIGKAAYKEIGWFSVRSAEESRQLAWFHELFKSNPTVFHWHGDRFGIPNGGLNLLSSDANTNQAFYYNENVIGLQFHLEVTEETAGLMLENCTGEFSESLYVQTKEQIKAGTVYAENCNRIMSGVLQNLLEK
ncbi:type 1 glutamine amidotransferase [uncultured Proteiniphilum sp.]|uniref:type 1 glutamine amidotransferase n=1 Tax=uncultured Proteiniphilum sp. TaxID=497637 RepID=UPI00261EFEE3|nr:type 1 glutamine amidotransferase [uncultured Proteiniphilum sp.]